jgi:hypothetical protein
MVTTARPIKKSELRLGERSPKHTHHSIICIGALIAHKENEHWVVMPSMHHMLASDLSGT